MNYREQLPEGCPPVESEEIASPREVFRLARTNPPTDDDFRSQRAEKPRARFNVDECRARGLSVHADIADSRHLRKLPSLRDRPHVCRVRLNAGAGRIQQTGAPSHHTWWPARDFDILPACAVEAEES
ncbi:MAG: hypothetical protein HY719_16030 [Planctomycetes bacterium]|nr:hypothetical protein [Planctomycetota bacterium]